MIAVALGGAHEHAVVDRRASVLGPALGAHVPPGAAILDVGTGDGAIARRMAAEAPGAVVWGVDIAPRAGAQVPVTRSDGRRLPFEDRSFDVVSLVDVLHQTEDPRVLLAEAARVARTVVIVKDILAETALDRALLRLRDRIAATGEGERPRGRYGAAADWERWFDAAGLSVEAFSTKVSLWPFPANLLFDRTLHFVARLAPPGAASGFGMRD
jgi:SAM-dependent methyltransferase